VADIIVVTGASESDKELSLGSPGIRTSQKAANQECKKSGNRGTSNDESVKTVSHGI